MPQVCRTCLCEITDESFISIRSDPTIIIQLAFCIPEMAPDLVIDPVICMPCKITLQSLYSFKQRCLQSDKRICEIIEVTKPNSLNLFEALYASNKVSTMGSQPFNECQNVALLSNIKEELKEEDEMLRFDHDIDVAIKTEEYDIELKEENELDSVENEYCRGSGEECSDTRKPIKTDQNENTYDSTDKSIKLGKISTKTKAKKKSTKKCKQVYKTKNLNQIIIKRYSKCKPVKCEVCNYTTRIKSNLKRHMERHINADNPLQCYKCSFRTLHKDNLKLHIAGAHSNVIRFRCKYCSYGTPLLKKLKRHSLIHTLKLEKRFKCDKCHYRTAHKCNLKIHIFKHNTELPFQCKCCNYATPDRACLKRHVMIHTGEKPYKCDKCSYETSQKFHLKRHSLSHIQCNICNYTTTKKSLNKHMRLHESDQ